MSASLTSGDIFSSGEKDETWSDDDDVFVVCVWNLLVCVTRENALEDVIKRNCMIVIIVKGRGNLENLCREIGILSFSLFTFQSTSVPKYEVMRKHFLHRNAFAWLDILEQRKPKLTSI